MGEFVQFKFPACDFIFEVTRLPFLEEEKMMIVRATAAAVALAPVTHTLKSWVEAFYRAETPYGAPVAFQEVPSDGVISFEHDSSIVLVFFCQGIAPITIQSKRSLRISYSDGVTKQFLPDPNFVVRPLELELGSLLYAVELSDHYGPAKGIVVCRFAPYQFADIFSS